MIFDGITSKLFNAIVKKLQGGIDSIQTTSRATLSQAGWYRVAEYAGGSVTNCQGFYANSCKLFIEMGAAARNGETHILQLLSAYQNQDIYTLGSTRHNTSSNLAVTKCRYTYDGTKAYLEVYYALSVSNAFIFRIAEGEDSKYAWKAITPTLTAETVDGVTVTITYDIPSNATPVNSVNLADAMENFAYSVVAVSSDTELSTALATLHNESTNVSTYERSIKFQYSHAELGGGYGTIRGFRQDANYGHQIIEKRNSTNTPVIAIRYLNNGVYSDWFYNATTADLANYMPLDGSKSIKKYLRIGDSSLAEVASLVLENAKRRIAFQVGTDGIFYLYDSTNKEKIFSVNPNGSREWYGTATGNLPLDGGGTVQKNYWVPLILESTVGNFSAVGFKGTEGLNGYLGVNVYGTPVFVQNDGKTLHKLLHESNYGDYNNFYKGLSVTDASGEEGGEIRWAQPQTDHSFGSMITQDIWRDIMRIHAMHDGVSKLFNIDFSSMKEGVNEALHTGNSTGIVFTEDDNTAPRSDMLWAHL